MPVFEGFGRMLWRVMLVAQIGQFIASAHAQIAAPEIIEQPIPTEWRQPVGKFLRELGMRDIGAVLENAKGGKLDDTNVLLRLEHKSLCDQEICLTMIGTITNSNFEPQAMFAAGRWTTRGDVLGNILGAGTSPPLWLGSSNRTDDGRWVTLIETSKGWIVVPGSK